MVWTYHVGTHFEALEKIYNESGLFFVSTKVTFQLLNRGHVDGGDADVFMMLHSWESRRPFKDPY